MDTISLIIGHLAILGVVLYTVYELFKTQKEKKECVEEYERNM